MDVKCKAYGWPVQDSPILKSNSVPLLPDPQYLPERGRPGLVPGTRELVALWPYVIVYRIAPEEVQILRIWHGAQHRSGK